MELFVKSNLYGAKISTKSWFYFITSLYIILDVYVLFVVYTTFYSRVNDIPRLLQSK